MISKLPILAAACALAFAGIPAPAHADIVVLTSGKTLSVNSHRAEADTVVLGMRSGGEVTVHRSLVASILPDEVPPQGPAASEPADADENASEQTTPAIEVAEAPFGEIITKVAEAHGVDPVLVSALIQVESNYRPRARSHKGAMGLMQLMPATARQYKVRNPYDPSANIAAGVKHLKSLIDRWGVEMALAAYNAGEAAVRKFKGVPPYRETRTYVRRILSLAGLE
jgi:soluble lytic murein transglycosylase-like protein